MGESDDLLLEIACPLGFRIRVTKSRWDTISTIKHPAVQGREEDLRTVLSEPDQVRRSRIDSAVYLFYRLERPGRWICGVVKRTDGEGFLITAYPTDGIKVGEQVWKR